MPVRRRRINRVAKQPHATATIVLSPVRWCVVVECERLGNKEYDFKPLCRHGREQLTGHVRDSFEARSKELAGATTSTLWSAVGMFWNFLEYLRNNGQHITELHEVDRTVLDQYVSWLRMRRLRTGARRGKKLSRGSQYTTYRHIKSLLVTCRRLAPDAISSELSFPANPFANIRKDNVSRDQYSDAELKRILSSCNTDLKVLHDGYWPHSDVQVLALYALIIGLTTGLNCQSILDIRRDSLIPHPKGDRWLLRTDKRRSGREQSTGLQNERNDEGLGHSHSTIPRDVCGHIQFLMEYTAPFAETADTVTGSFAFLHKQRDGTVRHVDSNLIYQAIRAFSERHSLKNDRGERLMLNVSRLRPTFATQLYRRTGDVRKVQEALGHADISTTMNTYIKTSPESVRNFAFAGEAMVEWATSRDKKLAREFAAKKGVDIENAIDLLGGGFNTVIARCRSPFREDGTNCGKYMSCFKCPSMVVFKDDLHRLLSFYYKLLSERHLISTTHWARSYGWVIKVIDNDILPQFDAQDVELARRLALHSPHPAWKHNFPDSP